MITEEQKLELVKALKSHTVSSIYSNMIKKMPVIIHGQESVITNIGSGNPSFEYGKSTIDKSEVFSAPLETISNGKTVVTSQNVTVNYATKKCRITCQKRFHYNDKWYTYKYSDDEPEFTFGILRVENMPYRSFEGKRNMRSFICSMNDLVYNGYCEPFMLFIDRKFVNWNNIHVVFDCDDTYLLLYGEKYNWYNLRHAETHMVVLPYKIEYIGTMSASYFDMMYEVTKQCIQDSLTVDENNRISIIIPGIETVYEYRGMIYNVGAWLYNQLKNNYLGLLTDTQIAKLKRIELEKYDYDNAGNVISTLVTKFNALDKDSYIKSLYDKICYMNKDMYSQKALFRFDDDGYLNPNGTNILAMTDESMEFEHYSSKDKLINHNSDYDSLLFTMNYLTFENNIFYPEYRDTRSVFIYNMDTIQNLNGKNIDIYIFKPVGMEKDIDILDNFYRFYLDTRIWNIVKDGVVGSPDSASDITFANFIYQYQYYLDYAFYDTTVYEDDYQNALKTLLNYDVRLFNDLHHTNIESTVISGSQANGNLTTTLAYEGRRGLKIPRNRYKNHECYVLVFEDGELLEEYSNMGVYPNFFFIPMNRSFNNNSEIELLYFNYINNNEITFELTDYMIERMPSADAKWRKVDIFDRYIKSNELKIFHDYPTKLIEYPTLVEPNEDIAFNISYRKDDTLYLKREATDDQIGKFTAVSSRKFIYQRLYAEHKSYRLVLDQRFRYCDNQKQYVLFINGRRMDDDTFLVTIPKYSRPFWGMYLYVTKFVGPKDRVELFYLPEELLNTNIDNSVEIQDNGYIENEMNNLEVPYDPRLYLFFINGKKIPSTDLISIDSGTLRLNRDTKSKNDLVINNIYTDTMPEIVDYMKKSVDKSKLTKYDNFIREIKTRNDLGKYDLLDKLFNVFVTISDIEEDKTKNNVAKIAIINEIIRDFWVTSGYGYNENPFVYDYDIDEFYMPKDKKGNIISPALDANQYINILKNEFHLLYFYASLASNYVEIGSTIDSVTFYWEFCKNLYNELKIKSQSFSYPVDTETEVDTEAREWTYDKPISKDISFWFKASTGYQAVESRYDIIFANGIYYGNVDEDILQYLKRDTTLADITEIMALVPKDGIIPKASVQEKEDPSLTALVYKQQNYVLDKLQTNIIRHIEDNTLWVDSIVSIDELMGQTIMIDSNGSLTNAMTTNQSTELPDPEYLSILDFQHILGTLNKKIHTSPELNLENYIIGNNNYFVYACPKRLAYDENHHFTIEFVMPDPVSDDIKANCRDDKTTPIYTDGEGWNDFKNHDLLNALTEMKMIYLGEFNYTNPSGYTEPYCVWRANGFFTRLFENYGFNIKVRFKDGAYYDDGLDHIIGGDEE